LRKRRHSIPLFPSVYRENSSQAKSPLMARRQIGVAHAARREKRESTQWC
jgi:hypothetical protein